MDFKRIFFIVVLSLNILSCDNYHDKTHEDELLISNKLSQISEIDGADQQRNKVALYDKVIGKIQKFDLSPLSYDSSWNIQSPEKEHFVLISEKNDFVIDLMENYVTVYKNASEVSKTKLNTIGVPLSAGFDEDTNLFVLYDDRGSVSILKFDQEGRAIKSFVTGPLLELNGSIMSGDIVKGGQLLLGLSNGFLATVDLEKTLDEQKWSYTSFDTGEQNMLWMAPLTENSTQLLVKTKSKIILYDLVTKTELDSIEFLDSDYKVVVKYSRLGTPHIVMGERERYYFGSKQYPKNLELIYSTNNQLVRVPFSRFTGFVMASRLDLSYSEYIMVKSDIEIKEVGNTLNNTKFSRSVLRFDINNFMVKSEVTIENNVEVRLSQSFVFTLFPEKLGHAKTYSLISDSVQEIKFFNLNDLK